VRGSHEQATVFGEGHGSDSLTEVPIVHDVNAIRNEPASKNSTLENVDPANELSAAIPNDPLTHIKRRVGSGQNFRCGHCLSKS
jgi:hypothetical protein